MTSYLLISFIAGLLTVLAPCVLPLLPVIVGGSITDPRNKYKPYIVTLSLVVSVFVFTLVLKVATIFINVPQSFWTYVSGIILIVFGLITIFPTIYEKATLKINLIISRKGNTVMADGLKKKSIWGDILIGASLGPVFSTCSPTYFVILATVLPQSTTQGLIDLLAYCIGLAISLLCIALIGQTFASKLEKASDPRGVFKRTLGVLFLIVGIFVITGYDKKFESYLLSSGAIFDITKVETRLLVNKEKADALKDTDQGLGKCKTGFCMGSSTNETATTTIVSANKKASEKDVVTASPVYPRYTEISNPSGFVNSDPITIGQYVGKKVIIVDFMTYTCINCKRTFPYLVSWYEKYKDDGLIIIGIHTPEFAFEKDINNVKTAMHENMINFPVVLDNDYGTWNAYHNNVWPRKYIIDIHGNVVYDHSGEGEYEETEVKIQELLKERKEVLKEAGNVDKQITKESTQGTSILQSQETYFGSYRNEFLANGTQGKSGEQTFVVPQNIISGGLYLGGTWDIKDEYAEAKTDATITYNFYAKDVFMVASAESEKKLIIKIDGKESKTLTVKDSTLYHIASLDTASKHLLEISVPAGVKAFTFTFGS